MNPCTTTVPTPPWTGNTFIEAVSDLARRVSDWLGARWRAADDRAMLAAMSDRELRDIGIERASVDAVADGLWMRG